MYADHLQYLPMSDRGPFGPAKRAVSKGGSGGDNGDMDPRISALEASMANVRDRLVVIETTLTAMPSKADLSAEVHTQTKWVIGIGFALMMAGITIAKLIN